MTANEEAGMKTVSTWSSITARSKALTIVQDHFGSVYRGFNGTREIGAIYEASRLVSRQTGEDIQVLFCRVIRPVGMEELRAVIRRSKYPRRKCNTKLTWYEIHAD